jgi:hypothetical protein
MLHRCDSEEEPERVFQLCIQLFPLSKGKPLPPPPKTSAPKTSAPRSVPPKAAAPKKAKSA